MDDFMSERHAFLLFQKKIVTRWTGKQIFHVRLVLKATKTHDAMFWREFCLAF